MKEELARRPMGRGDTSSFLSTGQQDRMSPAIIKSLLYPCVVSLSLLDTELHVLLITGSVLSMGGHARDC